MFNIDHIGRKSNSLKEIIKEIPSRQSTFNSQNEETNKTKVTIVFKGNYISGGTCKQKRESREPCTVRDPNDRR